MLYPPVRAGKDRALCLVPGGFRSVAKEQWQLDVKQCETLGC